MRKNTRLFLSRRVLSIVAVLIGLLGFTVAHAQLQPVFRIGVLGDADSPLTQGARLAVQQINAQGGVIGADGTIFQLQVVVQSPDDLEFAVANFNQSDVVAVIGPAASDTILGERDTLADLDVPILTAGTDDTLLTNDNTDRILRLRASELVQGRALADYLINEENIASLATVQLDLESTAARISFERAAAQRGLSPSDQYILSDDISLNSIIADIANSMPQVVVMYGPPEVAAELYTALRQEDYPGSFVYNQSDTPEFRADVPEGLLEGILGVATWSYTYENNISEEFVLDYLAAFGDVPTPVSAAAYDGVFLVREAISRPGSLLNNLLAISNYEGVQGVLNPSEFTPGEVSESVAITRLGRFGAPEAIARYTSGTLIETTEVEPDETPAPTETPRPTSTPIPSPTPDGVFLTVTRAVQNVRTGPGLDYTILGQLPEGSTARVIGATVDFSWVAISFRGTTGWLSRGILDITGDLNSVPVITPPPSPTPPPPTVTPTAQPIPDIVIVDATLERITIGQAFNVNVRVRNQGAAAAGAFAVAATYEPGGVFASVNLPGLGAFSETTITLSGTLTGGTGPQNVTIVADLNNQVNEGPAGETNNSAFIHRYVADAPLLNTAQATGTITLQETQTVSLDGGGGEQDIQWGGGSIVPLGSTRLGVLTNFTNYNQVHRDAIANANLMNAPITNVQPGQLIGVYTDNENKYGVLQIISVNPGVSITFNYRMYNS